MALSKKELQAIAQQAQRRGYLTEAEFHTLNFGCALLGVPYAELGMEYTRALELLIAGYRRRQQELKWCYAQSSDRQLSEAAEWEYQELERVIKKRQAEIQQRRCSF